MCMPEEAFGCHGGCLTPMFAMFGWPAENLEPPFPTTDGCEHVVKHTIAQSNILLGMTSSCHSSHNYDEAPDP